MRSFSKNIQKIENLKNNVEVIFIFAGNGVDSDFPVVNSIQIELVRQTVDVKGVREVVFVSKHKHGHSLQKRPREEREFDW